VAGDETVGIVGSDGAELTTLPVIGDTLVVGTAVVGLTPRLPISKEPSGVPARALPLGEDDVEVVDIGDDDAAGLLEPAPHIPDNPDVSIIPEDVDCPEVAEMADEVDMPDGIDVPEFAAVPDVAMVPGIVVPVAIPPPSKVAGDPNVPNGEVATVEHAPAPLLVLGTVTVPVTPLGTGLTVGAAPTCKPFAPTGAAGSVPSEEVTPSGGVSVPTWASAGLQHSRGHAVAAINHLMEHSPIRVEGLRRRGRKHRSQLTAEAIAFSFIAARRGSTVFADELRSTFR
jgi:hypothetical protein